MLNYFRETQEARFATPTRILRLTSLRGMGKVLAAAPAAIIETELGRL